MYKVIRALSRCFRHFGLVTRDRDRCGNLQRRVPGDMMSSSMSSRSSESSRCCDGGGRMPRQTGSRLSAEARHAMPGLFTIFELVRNSICCQRCSFSLRAAVTSPKACLQNGINNLYIPHHPDQAYKDPNPSPHVSFTAINPFLNLISLRLTWLIRSCDRRRPVMNCVPRERSQTTFLFSSWSSQPDITTEQHTHTHVNHPQPTSRKRTTHGS